MAPNCNVNLVEFDIQYVIFQGVIYVTNGYQAVKRTPLSPGQRSGLAGIRHLERLFCLIRCHLSLFLGYSLLLLTLFCQKVLNTFRAAQQICIGGVSLCYISCMHIVMQSG